MSDRVGVCVRGAVLRLRERRMRGGGEGGVGYQMLFQIVYRGV